jgi:hypothetical protein
MPSPALNPRSLPTLIGIGVLFVAAPVVAYAVSVPDHSRFIGECGGLSHTKEDPQLMVPLDSHPGKPSAIEVFDPLCPACRGFEERLAASDLDQEMDRKALLFPLDNSCNWMVSTTVHPGACTISEAMLCAGDRARVVRDWAFPNQQKSRTAAPTEAPAAAAMVKAAFPEFSQCVGSAGVRAKLNRSLRWAVQNRLPVLTPQLFVAGVKVCDEDTDLGLEFSLSRMLSQARAGTLKAKSLPSTPAAALPPEPEPVPVAPPPAAKPPEEKPEPEPAAEPEPEPTPAAEPEVKPAPTPAAEPEAKPEPAPTAEPEAQPEPEAKPEPSTEEQP